jgi:phosphatidylserine/phosphatidylglycerophosphate/cardiolipin synthase-like enzyme
MPDDSARPILDAIEGATTSIRVKMFVFSDPSLLKAVLAARKRGVSVRVMLNAARRSGESDNEDTERKLKAGGVEVISSNPEYDVTHEKSMVVDDHTAFIKSLNWQTTNLTATRDYAIVTHHAHEVAEVIEGFEADWARKPFQGDDQSHLIWCIGNGRERIAQFIDDAKQSLILQNERYQDSVIIERLVRAARRGVEIHLMARPAHKLKKEKLSEAVGGLRILDDVGVKIAKLKHLKLHGKMLLADHKRAIVGSINLAPGSFDSRRELAIEVDDSPVVERLHDVTAHDWKHSHPLDLTDAGLQAEMEAHKMEASEALGLRDDPKREDKPTRAAKG